MYPGALIAYAYLWEQTLQMLPWDCQFPSPGRQVELRPHLCSHLERVWRGVAGRGCAPAVPGETGPPAYLICG